MKQGGSIAEPGSEVFGISHGAQFTRSACNAGQDVNTPWPRQVGDLSGRQANNARRIGDSQRAWKGLLQRVETRRTVRTCRFTRACRPRRHRIRTWLRRSELANALCRSTLTIWWRSAQCGGVAASRGRTAVVNPPCTRPQEPSFFQKEIRDFHDGVEFSSPDGPVQPGNRRDAHSAGRVPCPCLRQTRQFRSTAASGGIVG